MSTAAGQRSKRKYKESKDEIPSTGPTKVAAEEGAIASSSKPTRGTGIGIGIGIGVGVGVGRVTRRSVANATIGIKGDIGKDKAGESSREGQAEAGPSTAPERDTVSKSTKRPRKSRTSHTPPSTARPFSPSKEQPQSTSLPQPPLSLLRRHLPYPIGLTPYRYTCLHPTLPPPPPGDPLDSNWKPYDPNHVSHLGPLPDSVRALSALGQDRPIIRPRGLRTSVGDKDIDPSLQGPEGSGSIPGNVSGGIHTESTSDGIQKRREGEISTTPYYPLDPSLANLPHPPIPQPGPNSGQGISNGDLHPQQHRSGPIDPSDPGFDINTFLESATYESLTALLAAGDDVGGGPTNG